MSVWRRTGRRSLYAERNRNADYAVVNLLIYGLSALHFPDVDAQIGIWLKKVLFFGENILDMKIDAAFAMNQRLLKELYRIVYICEPAAACATEYSL